MAKSNTFQFKLGDVEKEWIEQWALRHCEKRAGSPNISMALSMIIEISMLIDITPEYREIINKEFDGDYRAFLRRAARDYHKLYEETLLGDQFPPSRHY